MKLLPSLWPCNDKKDHKKEKDISVYPIIKEKRGRYILLKAEHRPGFHKR